jgi:hypothetical protein
MKDMAALTRQIEQPKKNAMRISLLIALTTLTAGLAGQAFAGDVFLSPRAAQMAYSLRTVPSAGDPNLLANIQYGNAKARQFDSRTVAGTGRDIDFVHAARPTLAPKDPRFETALRENAVHEFQIAPLK